MAERGESLPDEKPRGLQALFDAAEVIRLHQVATIHYGSGRIRNIRLEAGYMTAAYFFF